MGTPNPQDIFSRFMVRAFDDREMISVSTGFQAFFGNPASGAQTVYSPDANVVDIDIIKGNERLAALVPRGNVSRLLGPGQANMRGEKSSTFSRKYPLSEEEADISADKLLNRVPGESPYDRQTIMNRLRYHARTAHMESVRRHIRLFEVLAAESILTGKQSAILGTTNTDLQYDFRRTSTHTATVNTSWAGGAADILTDVDTQCAKIRANGKTTADMMVMGSLALSYFIADTTNASLADNRRFSFMAMGTDTRPMPPKFQRFIDGGFIYQGTLRTPAGNELYIFTYLDVYTASNGTATKYLADDKVIICNSQARCDRYFGPGEVLPITPAKAALYREYFGFDPNTPPMPPAIRAAGSVIEPSMFYCDAYVSSDDKKITIRTQAAPIFATTHTDAFVVLDVVP